MYTDAKVVQSLLARYQSDADYKAAVDYLFTAPQQAELAAMIAQVNTLLTDWETNHSSVLGQEG